ncbi:MAG: hypothetical protein U5J64_02745 [Halobacteriales archaeon]|nr:hypothetical protein [Halobacteriales archaeon]
MNFLHHRDGVVLELVRDREPTVYLAEIDGDVLVTTEKTDGYKTLEETWHEEVRLNQYIAGCRVVIHEDGGTPFDDVLREKVVA